MDSRLRFLRARKLLGSPENKLHALKVTLVGLGGLGGYAALYCAQLGIRSLTLIDRDLVTTTDLGRHALFTAAQVGKPKVKAAAQRLAKMNPEMQVNPVFEQLEESNASELLGGDAVLDATDNYATRAVINQWSVASKTPAFFASGLAYRGWAFACAPQQTACLKCWAPEPKREESCQQVGVLNTTVAMAATLQTQMLIDWAMGGKKAIRSEVQFFSTRPLRLERVNVVRRTDCPVCGIKNGKN